MAVRILASTLLFISLTILLGCGGQAADSPAQAAKASPTPCVNCSGVVFFGDSIFGNWNLPSYFPNEQYVNGGYFGQRTDQQLERLPDVLSGKQVCSGFDGVPSTLQCGPLTPPKTVVIYLGWNDLFQAKDPQAAANNIEQMVVLCKSAGVRPVIATLYHFDPAHLPPWNPNPIPEPFGIELATINSAIHAVATRQNVPLVDLEKVFSGQSDYTSDGVHPLPSGYVQMHDAISRLL